MFVQRLKNPKKVLEMATKYDFIYASVGVHPDYNECLEPSVSDLIKRGSHKKNSCYWRNRVGLL